MTDVLLAALNEPNPRLIGIALDVTDPEPLPDKHPLYAHPRVIITPHSSGGITGYNDRAADVLFANLDKWDKGEKLLTPVDPKKGY